MYRASVTAALLLALAPVAARAQPNSATDRKRQQILKQLGIDRKPGSAPAPKAPPTPSQEPPADAATVPRPTVTVFVGPVHAALRTACGTCHGPGGTAATTRFVLGSGARTDFDRTSAFVVTAHPADSALIVKGGGDAHGGGRIVVPGTRLHRQLITWIADGARFEAGSEPTAVVALPARAKAPSQALAPVRPETTTAMPVPAVAPASSVGPAPSPPAPDPFQAVHALVSAACRGCHNSMGTAGGTRMLLGGEAAADLVTIRAFVDLGQPAASPLLTKAAGAMHGGGVIYSPAASEYQSLLAWVTQGAPGPLPVAAGPAGTPPASPAATPAAPTAPPPVPPPAGAIPAVGHGHGHGAGGLGLPLGLRLNGRFDLAYERRSLGPDTSFADGTSALRSYHQFLFLSRRADDAPIGFTVELVSLQIWEATFFHRFETLPATVLVRGGKMLIPFGAEPFHQLYGGLGGFDQKILPPLWAAEGVGEQLTFLAGGLSVSSDLYVVRGHHLRAADTVLNLQNDLSAVDDAKLAAGHRLGLAWGPATAWHSLYVNPLGFGRLLVMQAVDLGFGRLRDIPILGRFTAAVGLVRADISGGEAGRDYYHFGSYAQGRFFATDWLYVQYRQGLRTFNNRRGTIVDDTRLDATDGSTHTAGVVARWHGLTAGAHYFWNFEKAAEGDDDFLRLVVACEF